MEVNAPNATFICPGTTFFKHNVAGHHIWINTAVEQLPLYIKHYQRCKTERPFDTSAVILMPNWPNLHNLTEGMQLLKEYPAGTTIFTVRGNTNDAHKTYSVPYPLQVWYDPPQQPALRIANPDKALMFTCTIGKQRATALIDTGASHTIIHDSLVPHGSDVKPTANTTVEVADGKRITLKGSTNVPILIQKYMAMIPALIMPTLLPGIDIVLGMDWMRANGVLLDIPAMTCILNTPANGSKKPIQIIADSQRSHTASSGGEVPAASNAGIEAMRRVCAALATRTTPDLMSASAARRAIKKNTPGMLVIVREAKRSNETTSSNETTASASNTTLPLPPPLPIFTNTPHLCPIQTTESAGTIPEAKLTKLIDEFKDVFEPIKGLPKDRNIGHTIDLEPSAKPVFSRMYRLSPQEQDEVQRQVEDLISKGLIQPSASPWGAPVLFAAKKDGGLRMCIDYRQLNKVTIKNRYPIPNPEDLFDALAGATIFSSIDLQSGYHQIRINEQDRHKTAFRTPSGHYEFLVLSMGLANAPATFQAVMNSIFRPYIGKFVLVYLDDIIVFSKTPEEHEQHIRVVLEALQKEQLQAKLSKCEFNKQELKFLGMVVSKDGLKVDETKVKVVRDWPTPTDVSSLRGFLGLSNYFRKFIQGYASLAAPLTKLTGSKQEWIWGPEQQEAFDGIKNALTHAPVLKFPDIRKPFEVISDASVHGTGGVLVQEGRPVAYTSTKFSAAEKNYTTTEQELLGVINALKQWRCYLEGPQITLVTDHNPNTFIDTQKSLSRLSRRQVRWIEHLARFNYTWEYRPGRINVADPLSRLHALLIAAQVRARYEFTSDLLDLLRAGYEHDGYFKNPRAMVKHSIICDEDGIYRCQGAVVVPDHRELRNRILKELHDSPYAGHRGVERTLELVSREFWWPGITADVKRYVGSCDLCQRHKPRTQKVGGLLEPLAIPEHVWGCVSMDFITHLPRTAAGYDAIVTFVCRLSKMVRFAPTTATATAEDLAILFRDNVIRHHGFPSEVLSDRGPQFVSKFWQEVLKLTGTSQRLSTAYHPQTDGQTERMHRLLQEILRNYVDPTHTDWDQRLSMAEFAINNTYQESIKGTPFQLNNCRNPRIPTLLGMKDSKVPSAIVYCTDIQEQLERAKRFIAKAQERYKHNADKHRQDTNFQLGQKVLLSTQNIKVKQPGTPKLLPKWIGPFPIVKLVGPVAVKLELPAQYKIHDVFHVSLIKPYKARKDAVPPGPIAVLEDGPYWAIDRILAHRDVKVGKKTRREYWVSWDGYGPENNSWEPEDGITDAAIDEYWASQAIKAVKPTSAEAVSAPAKRRSTRIQG